MSIQRTKDGRTIRSGKDYTEFRLSLWKEQAYRCMDCNRITDATLHPSCYRSFHVAHRGSRGMGGAIRDDVVGPKRGQVEGGKCSRCHRQEHSQ